MRTSDRNLIFVIIGFTLLAIAVTYVFYDQLNFPTLGVPNRQPTQNSDESILNDIVRQGDLLDSEYTIIKSPEAKDYDIPDLSPASGDTTAPQ
ncbi:MAG: hypothetical protein A3B30_02220 [Candidatus Komeilibacteria bacterium RIFCSPLOWO2_01_FULL_52_15]|uniref:Uncharacterized protein n=2 Tax=Candidatus Komeiliibacteriota TaxID=1817908 RepID=A0A1G2BV69_9BACT|nr:MAG: hypothetical protein A2677_01160 [Candidatus Komeilibacteria bacterium RIFCSPHIGHO2_01_FULL_52_14]OGY92180.1 MAG: hypothetical protein A3B30_02220 [Candidatus Komeilibacteria bacterium RIFCSPLOWO2_01_FULL_52_15]